MSYLPKLKFYIFILPIILSFSIQSFAGLPPKPEYTAELIQLRIDSGRVLRVGRNEAYTLPSMAAKAAHDGDTIEIQADGDYLNDEVIWKQNNLLIKGVSGRPYIKNNGVTKNGKGLWVIRGDNITIKNFEFSGAKVKDKNGAALRLEGKNFHISNSYIHNNQNGILAGNRQSESVIIIEHCEFASNGHGDGLTHNVYIGTIAKLIFRENYTHDANVGHTLKTRARENYILYNRIIEGNSSYSIDIPDGGYALVIGNIIYQGENTENATMVAYGLENKNRYANSALDLAYNTFVNERSNGIFVKTRGNNRIQIKNNLFSGNGKIIEGDAIVINNVHERDLVAKFDVKEVKVKPKYLNRILDKAVDVVSYHNQLIIPEREFSMNRITNRPLRGQRYDIGAFEYPAGILDILK